MKNAAEILRLLNNLIRIGTIEEIDHKAARVRVISGDNLTDWLPWRAARAGKTKTWDPPTKGEQVLLLSPSGDLSQAIILTAIYSDDNPAPSSNPDEYLREFPDGALIRYNHKEKKLTIKTDGDVAIDAGGNVSVKAGMSATVEAKMNVDIKAAALVSVDAAMVKLKDGAGVVTGAHICAYTGSPHAHCSMTVTAGL